MISRSTSLETHLSLLICHMEIPKLPRTEMMQYFKTTIQHNLMLKNAKCLDWHRHNSFPKPIVILSMTNRKSTKTMKNWKIWGENYIIWFVVTCVKITKTSKTTTANLKTNIYWYINYNHQSPSPLSWEASLVSFKVCPTWQPLH